MHKLASHLPTPGIRESEMEELAKKVLGVFELLPEEVRSSQLEEGDHIFVYRTGYSHHGIYVGQKDGIQFVIHFNKKLRPCPKCKHKADHRAKLILTCLDCFLYEVIPFSSSLYRYRYGVCRPALPGTCTSLTAKPPKEVVKIAYDLLENGFGKYDLLLNNCEHFATFCKTGVASSAQANYAFKLAMRPMMLSPVGSILEIMSITGIIPRNGWIP